MKKSGTLSLSSILALCMALLTLPSQLLAQEQVAFWNPSGTVDETNYPVTSTAPGFTAGPMARSDGGLSSLGVASTFGVQRWTVGDTPDFNQYISFSVDGNWVAGYVLVDWFISSAGPRNVAIGSSQDQFASIISVAGKRNVILLDISTLGALSGPTEFRLWYYNPVTIGGVANAVFIDGSPIGGVGLKVFSAGMQVIKTGTFYEDGLENGSIDAGDEIDYEYLIKNLSDDPLTNISVTDPMPNLPAISCPSGNPIPTLDVGAEEICTATLVLTENEFNLPSLENTVTADSAELPPVRDILRMNFVERKGAIGLSKQIISITPVGDGDYAIEMRVLAENLGTVDLTSINIEDDLVSTFGNADKFELVEGPFADGSLLDNPSYDGASDIKLLGDGSELAPGTTGAITYVVKFNPDGNIGPYTTRASVGAVGFQNELVQDLSNNTEDPDPNGNGDATEAGENEFTFFSFPEAPTLQLQKVSLFNPASHDTDNNGVLSPGDTLPYQITLSTSVATSLDVSIADQPDMNTTLVPGSVTTSQGTIISGNTNGDTEVIVDLNALQAGIQNLVITFETIVNAPLDEEPFDVSNQATVSGLNFATVLSDDPSDPGAADPTVDSVVTSNSGVLSIDPASVMVNEDAGTVQLMVIRSEGASGEASVRVDTIDETAQAGLDYDGIFGATVNFADGDSTPKPIVVTLTNDEETELDETFIIQLSEPTGAVFGVDSATITIADDERRSEDVFGDGFESE